MEKNAKRANVAQQRKCGRQMSAVQKDAAEMNALIVEPVSESMRIMLSTSVSAQISAWET
jgi:hypothetical protein